MRTIERGERWPIEWCLRGWLSQQRLDFATDLWISLCEKLRSFGRVGVEGRMVQVFDLAPTLSVHRRSARVTTTLWPTANRA
jgi:hypothetical protein